VSAPAWLADLRAAVAALDDSDTLAALARGLDADADPPTPQALAAYLAECPGPAKDTATDRLRTLARVAVPEAPGDLVAGLTFAVIEGRGPYGGPHLLALWPTAPRGRHARLIGPDWIETPWTPAMLSRRWLDARGLDGCPPHPLAPIVRAWIERPPKVRGETRPNPLLPVVQSVSEAPERTAGRLAFGGVLDAGNPRPGQLPLFPAPEGPRVALLELTDAHGVPTMAQGRGAPLELATYVAACVLTPYDFRTGRARLVTSVRELRSFLFGAKWRPRSAGGDRPGDWQRVRDAALHASGLWLPVPHPDGGAADLWRAVAVRKIPPADYDPSHLDREVIFDVELPDGAADGPPIDREELSRLRRVSGPRFRAYLAAHSIAWRPGLTRVPHPRNRRVRVWSGNPAKYPVLTAADRDRLTFGEGWEDRRRKEGRTAADSHWERLPGSVILTRKATTPDGRRGWLIVPDAAADAIRKRRDRGE